jgi:hypothetical protein
MPKKVSSLYRLEQPISWGRAFFCGMLGSAILMAWLDIFYMMGFTTFNLEVFVGTILRNSTEFMPRAWLVGAIANLIFGGIFGIFYGYLFEYIYQRSGAGIGFKVGIFHAAFAGIAMLPFFQTVHEQMGIQLYPNGLGFLGSHISAVTPLLIVTGHLLFGSTMGLFYGPVQLDRIRTRNFEPGEVGYAGDPDVITAEEDPSDATPSVPYHAPGSAFPRRRHSRSA